MKKTFTQKLIKAFKSPQKFVLPIIVKRLYFIFPEEMYLKILFRLIMGQNLNLKQPKTFNEKLQWLKLYNRKPEYTTMVDKYAVKKYVSNIIGKEYIIPTLGIWNNWEEINFNELPNQFVLKTTHGGGGTGVVICRDKTTLDFKKSKVTILKSMRSDIYKTLREWPYKNVEKRIIAEELIIDKNNPQETISDYKFYCFSGKVEYLLISHGRFTNNKTFDYFDRDFNRLPFAQGGKNSNLDIHKPPLYDIMIEIAEKLSHGIPHIRVDLYNVNGKIYFSELTFFDASGFETFEPKEWDLHWGRYIELPTKVCK